MLDEILIDPDFVDSINVNHGTSTICGYSSSTNYDWFMVCHIENNNELVNCYLLLFQNGKQFAILENYREEYVSDHKKFQIWLQRRLRRYQNRLETDV